MAHVKHSKWYRRPSLAYSASAEEISKKNEAYVKWLAAERGWIVTEKSCERCYGSGRAYDPDVGVNAPSWQSSCNRNAAERRWRMKRLKAGKPPYLIDDDKITCWECEGRGRVTIPPELDLKRARQHVAEQQAELERLAERVVDSLKHRLFWYGLRPVETMQGWCDESRWYADRKGGCVYVGTRNAPRYRHWNPATQCEESNPPAVSIVIRPGRAPSGYELDLLAEEAVAAIALAIHKQEDEGDLLRCA